MKQNDFTLYNHNMSLNHFPNTSALNFCKMLYADPSRKLSVIAEFTPKSDGYITLSKSLDIAAISCTNHSNVVEDFYSGKDRAFGFLVGQVMKKMKGKGDPAKVNEVLRGKL